MTTERYSTQPIYFFLLFLFYSDGARRQVVFFFECVEIFYSEVLRHIQTHTRVEEGHGKRVK